jgi:hypothetical protein
MHGKIRNKAVAEAHQLPYEVIDEGDW